MNESNLIIYKTDDGKTNIALYARDGDVWLSLAQIPEFLATSKQNISLHIIQYWKRRSYTKSQLLRIS